MKLRKGLYESRDGHLHVSGRDFKLYPTRSGDYKLVPRKRGDDGLGPVGASRAPRGRK